MKERYDWNDLPRFSPWPARLLGLAPWNQRCKSEAEIFREFELETWGPLLERVREATPPMTLRQVNELVHGNTRPTLCSIGSELIPTTALDAQNRYCQFVQEALCEFLPASAVAELGCGYGRIILRLAKSPWWAGIPLFAADCTASAVSLLATLAEHEGISVRTAACDFSKAPITELPIPPGAVIYTSYAAHYIPQLSDAFVISLLAFKPKIVVHFEPCYEHCDDRSLAGLMRRRYIEVNDYNRNLVSLLKDCESRGMIKITRIIQAAFGSNPLLPASVVAWTGCG